MQSSSPTVGKEAFTLITTNNVEVKYILYF